MKLSTIPAFAVFFDDRREQRDCTALSRGSLKRSTNEEKSVAVPLAKLARFATINPHRHRSSSMKVELLTSTRGQFRVLYKSDDFVALV